MAGNLITIIVKPTWEGSIKYLETLYSFAQCYLLLTKLHYPEF